MRAGGPVCVITGGTSGLGRAAAEQMARRGYSVVVVGRDPARCAAVFEDLRSMGAAVPQAPIIADLALVDSVRRVAEELTGRYPRIDCLINNAGGLFSPRQETPEGHERTFALNVLAPYQLSRRLEPALRAAGGCVVNVASAAHRGHRLDLTDLELARGYRAWRAYGRSKLALILLTREFARRAPEGRVRYFAVHPGFVRSGFGKNNSTGMRVIMTIAMAFAISPEQGARTIVYGATSPALAGRTGEYLAHGAIARASAAAGRAEDGAWLWESLAPVVGLPPGS